MNQTRVENFSSDKSACTVAIKNIGSPASGAGRWPAIKATACHFDVTRFSLISLALLAPCWWQSRIQAGDLSSHLYNAWLRQLIQEDKLHGLTVVTQWTNILFDVVLPSRSATVSTTDVAPEFEVRPAEA